MPRFHDLEFLAVSSFIVFDLLDPAFLLASEFVQVPFDLVDQMLQILDILDTVQGAEPEPLEAVVGGRCFGLCLTAGGRDDAGLVLAASIGQVGREGVPLPGEEAGAAVDHLGDVLGGKGGGWVVWRARWVVVVVGVGGHLR